MRNCVCVVVLIINPKKGKITLQGKVKGWYLHILNLGARALASESNLFCGNVLAEMNLLVRKDFSGLGWCFCVEREHVDSSSNSLLSAGESALCLIQTKDLNLGLISQMRFLSCLFI